jgi:hypothetical protein
MSVWHRTEPAVTGDPRSIDHLSATASAAADQPSTINHQPFGRLSTLNFSFPLSLAVAVLILGCRGIHESPTTPSAMNAPDVLLTNQYARPFYNSTETPDSPRPPNDAWRGVLISTPTQATLTAKQPMLLIRGTWRIQGDKYPKDDRLRLIAVNLATKQEYARTAGQRDPSPDEPPPKTEPPDPAVIKRMIFSGFFNADLLGTVRLPWAAATYRVRAELGDIRSNEITIQVQVQ